MKVEIRRTTFSPKSTIGNLYVDDTQICYTLEDKARSIDEKKYGETAIPYGEYPLVFTKTGTIYESYKTRFKHLNNERGMILIDKIPGYSRVMIHCGNTPEDTLGCPLVGLTKGADRVEGSTMAYEKFYPIVARALENGEEVTLSITGGDKPEE
jgi:hypothetical protein